MRKTASTLVWILIFLYAVEITHLSFCTNSGITNSTTTCIENERRALLQFKKGFTVDSSGRLSSWKGPDCCNWVGVECSFGTRHVTKLDLRNTHDAQFSKSNNNVAEALRGPLEYDPSSYFFDLIADRVDSCLRELRHLNYLDLSGVTFTNSSTLNFLGSMTSLRYLNLSGGFYSGFVPRQLGNLTNLRVLDLSSIGFELKVEDFSWVAGLTSLKYLDMSGIDFSKASNVVPALYMLPSLLVLHLSYCELSHIHFSEHEFFSANLSSVQELDISFNYRLEKSPVTLFLQNMTALRVLDVSTCYLSLSLPKWVQNFKHLTHLDVSGNSFSGADVMSSVLSHLCSLKSLDMSYTTFLNESLPFDGSLSSCREYDLEFLSLSSTGMTGTFPKFIAKFRNLKYLMLGANALHGQIPTTIADNFPLLRVLDLSSNQLNGVIPYSIGELINIVRFDVSYNSLEGDVYDHIHLSSLSNLKVFSTSFNNLLSFVFKPDWFPPFQIKIMNMGSCKVHTFPQWLAAQTALVELHLPNASISDSWPKWIQNSNLRYLDLSSNHITRPLLQNVGDIFPEMQSLHLSDNHINGTVPRSLCKMISLIDLGLSRNMLSGDIPDCWGSMNKIEVLSLASNNLTGTIPSSIGYLSHLGWLQLNNNSLKGALPLSLRNCTSLELLNLGENGLSGNLPSWMGETLWALRALRLRKNMFDGHIPQEICQLSILSFLDLADNRLTGRIPHCFGNLSGMFYKIEDVGFGSEWDEVNVEVVVKGKEYIFTKTLRLLVNMDLSLNNLAGIIPEEITNLAGLNGLNFSHNHLTGNIPKSIGKLESLESLDFSVNKLSRNIPTGISDLTSLSNLNLAGTNLSGKIPRGRQLETIDHDNPSIYADNPELCGEPLENRCPGDPATLTPMGDNAEEDEQENEHDKIWLYSFVTLGYATGLWGFIGVLVFKRNWRFAFFRVADEMRDWIYVQVVVSISRLQRKMMERN